MLPNTNLHKNTAKYLQNFDKVAQLGQTLSHCLCKEFLRIQK